MTALRTTDPLYIGVAGEGSIPDDISALSQSNKPLDAPARLGYWTPLRFKVSRGLQAPPTSRRAKPQNARLDPWRAAVN